MGVDALYDGFATDLIAIAIFAMRIHKHQSFSVQMFWVWLRQFLALVLIFCALPSTAEVSIKKLNAKELLVTQVVNGVGTLSTSVTARVGPVGFSLKNGARQNSQAMTITNAASIGSATPQNYGTGQTISQITASATSSLNGQASALAAAIGHYLSANGIARGTFSYDQELSVQGITRPMRLVWLMTVDKHGKASYGDPKVVDSAPSILYVVYTQKAVMQGLPSGWRYPNAGILQYQLRKPDGTALSAWVQLDTGGAYDEPQSVDGSAVDPDFGLKCLIRLASSVSCPTGLPDVVGLIDQTAAMTAVLDYVRVLRPVYDQTETPPGSGNYQQIARVSLSVTSRTVDSSCSAATYRNIGSYGFTLRNATDRYWVQASGEYNAVNQFTSTSISPTENYDLSMPVSVSQLPSLYSQIINPGATNTLIDTASIPNLISLAAIETTSSVGTKAIYNFYRARNPYGMDFNVWNTVYLTCDAGNVTLQLADDWIPDDWGSCTPLESCQVQVNGSWTFALNSSASGQAGGNPTYWIYNAVGRGYGSFSYDGAGTITLYYYPNTQVGRGSVWGSPIGPTVLSIH